MASKFLIDQAIADANNYGLQIGTPFNNPVGGVDQFATEYGLQVGTPFNNPVGGVDQFATEMEALEAARAGDTVSVNELGGTLEDFYTNRNPDTDANTQFEVWDDNINFNNATVQPEGIVDVNHVKNLIANAQRQNALNNWTSIYGNPELYQGFVKRGEPLAVSSTPSKWEQITGMAGDVWDKTKEIGTRFKEGAAPVFGIASMIGNATNPLNPNAFNYNPELAGQLNFIDQQFPGMITNNPSSGLFQYSDKVMLDGELVNNPLRGQNVMSVWGSNDPIAQLEKQMARHQKTIDKLPDMWSNLKETDIDAYNKKLNIHKTRLKNAEILRDTILANKKARIAKRAQAERDFVTQGLGVTAADAATSGRGMDHTRGMTSRERGAAAARMGGGSRQAKSGSQKAGGSGRTDKGWGWARGGRVGYANGGLASLFTRRG